MKGGVYFKSLDVSGYTVGPDSYHITANVSHFAVIKINAGYGLRNEAAVKVNDEQVYSFKSGVIDATVVVFLEKGDTLTLAPVSGSYVDFQELLIQGV